MDEKRVLQEVRNQLTVFIDRKESGQSLYKNTYHDFKVLVEKIEALK